MQTVKEVGQDILKEILAKHEAVLLDEKSGKLTTINTYKGKTSAKRNRGRILGRFTSSDSVGWGTAARTLDDMCVCIRTTATCQTTSLAIIQDGDLDPGAAFDLGSRRYDL